MITVKTLFFAHYQDLTGCRETSLPLEEGETVGDLASLIAQRYEGLSDLLTAGRVAVNAEFADASTILQEGDEVAFLPPMSGGC
jgi:molybdopterin converting factor subunit 1